MISEPELVGGAGFERSEVLTETPPPGPPRARRPWLWALGGAVVASALWGAGLYAYAQKEERKPDLGGYEAAEDLCEKAKVEELVGVLGETGEKSEGVEVDDPAVYRGSCWLTFGPLETGYTGSVEYTVHRVTDPETEFEGWAKHDGLVVPVDGIGEKAFFDDRGGEGGELRVLDGQVEIVLGVSRQYSTDDEGGVIRQTEPVDLSGIEVPMTQDVLALMAELKK
ncbi:MULTISPECIES: hypothetical protein [unclassified Streptomyces]|uniref:hypothetical protein n=1 Tax=unclassified Streptomyces TaxID=2593676 RepID=UPI0033B5CCA6